MSQQNVPPAVTQVIITQAPQPSNGLGITGFILSLVGMISCGFLSPLALIFSLIGLRKEPKGLAIAGTVISLISFIPLFLFGGTMIAAILGAAGRSSATSKIAAIQATQLTGGPADGKSALESIKIARELDAGGHFKSLVVTEVVPGGAMEHFYGLKKGDKIITEGQYEVNMNGDAGTASAMLLDAFEKFQPLVVIRDGQQVTLPLGGAGKAAQDQFNQLQHLGEK